MGSWRCNREIRGMHSRLWMRRTNRYEISDSISGEIITDWREHGRDGTDGRTDGRTDEVSWPGEKDFSWIVNTDLAWLFQARVLSYVSLIFRLCVASFHRCTYIPLVPRCTSLMWMLKYFPVQLQIVCACSSNSIRPKLHNDTVDYARAWSSKLVIQAHVCDLTLMIFAPASLTPQLACLRLLHLDMWNVARDSLL